MNRPTAKETALNIIRHVKSMQYRIGDAIPSAVLLGVTIPADITNAETNAGINYAKNEAWIAEVPMSNGWYLTATGWSQI
jgi:hypothetical protein